MVTVTQRSRTDMLENEAVARGGLSILEGDIQGNV